MNDEPSMDFLRGIVQSAPDLVDKPTSPTQKRRYLCAFLHPLLLALQNDRTAFRFAFRVCCSLRAPTRDLRPTVSFCVMLSRNPAAASASSGGGRGRGRGRGRGERKPKTDVAAEASEPAEKRQKTVKGDACPSSLSAKKWKIY